MVITRRHVVPLVVVGVLAFGGWHYAQAQSPTLTAQDYSDITELYARLYQAADLRETDTWLSSFADDGVFAFPNGDEVSGKKALAEWRAKTFAGATGDSRRRHWTSGVTLTPLSNGTAKGRAYFLLIDVSAKQPVVTSSGMFEDVFVKTRAGWKFKRHGVVSDPTK